jgi:hypothetical protein
VGGALGPLIGGALQRRLAFVTVFAGGWIAQALLWIALPFIASVNVLALIAGVIMICDQVASVSQFTLRAQLIPKALQGRVQASFKLPIMISQPVGFVLLGWGVEQLGATTTILIGAGALLLLGCVAFVHPAVRAATFLPDSTPVTGSLGASLAQAWRVGAWVKETGPGGATSVFTGPLLYDPRSIAFGEPFAAEGTPEADTAAPSGGRHLPAAWQSPEEGERIARTPSVGALTWRVENDHLQQEHRRSPHSPAD